MLFKDKKQKTIFLGFIGLLVVGAVVIGGNLVDLQGRTRIKNTAQIRNQQATQTSIEGAIKVTTLPPTSGSVDLTYTSSVEAKVYSFEIRNNYSAEIKIHKITAEYSQEGWDDSVLRQADSWRLYNSTGKVIAYSEAGSYGHIPFELNSPVSIKSGGLATFWIKTILSHDADGYRSSDQNMINVWLQEDTLGKVSVGPKYGWSYDEVNDAGSWFILSTNSEFYFNSAYPDNSNQSVNKLPTSVVRTTCGESQGCEITSTSTEAGKITVQYADNPVLDDAAVAGADSESNPLLVARFKVFAEKEDFKVTKMVFRNDAAQNSNVDHNAISKVILKYPTSVSAPETLDGYASISLVNGDATFTGLNMMIPASETDENAIQIELYTVTNEVGSGTNSGNQIELDFEESTGFEAVGQTSSVVVTSSSDSTLFGTTSDIDSNEIALYKTLPTFQKDNSDSAPCPDKLLASEKAEVYCFSVAANSAGDVGLYSMTFDATPYLVDFSSKSWYLYEYQTDGTVGGDYLGTGVWSSSSNSTKITLKSEQVISKGTSKYYLLTAPVTLTSSTDTSSITTRLAAESVSNASANTTASNAALSGKNVWSDRSAASHSTKTYDWMNSYKIEYLPTEYSKISE